MQSEAYVNNTVTENMETFRAVSTFGDGAIFEAWLRFHTDIDASLKLVVPMMAFTHTALPAAMSVSE